MTSDKLGREYMAPPIDEHISGPGAGTYTVGAANPPGTPGWVGNATEQISVSLDQNGNGDQSEYVFKVEENEIEIGFVQADGTVGAGEVWRTAAQWGGVIVVKGLAPTTTPKAYRFAAKARNVEDTETAYSAWSVVMMPAIDLAYSPISSATTYEPTTGNCRISGLTVTGTSKVVTIGYTLTRINSPTTKNNVKIYYSTAARILADPTDYTEITAAPAITGDVNTLTASVSGTAHTNSWATCTTLGNSYNATVYVKVVPYDQATGGNPETAATTTCAVDNRPVATTIAEISGLAWDSDTTPEFVGPLGDVVCGDYLYTIVRIYDASGAEIQANSSAETPAGWYYEQNHAALPGSDERGNFTNWTAVTYLGIPATYAPPTATGNRWRYVMQTPLTPGQVFSVKVQQAEISHTLA